MIRDVAQNILSFLKSNATKEGHTYWLFKGKDDDIVKLYDLTSLCDGEAAATTSTETGTKQSSFKESPFKTAVAMLLYKVARNVLHGGGGDSAAGGTAQKLLINCLKLLDKVCVYSVLFFKQNLCLFVIGNRYCVCVSCFTGKVPTHSHFSQLYVERHLLP